MTELIAIRSMSCDTSKMVMSRLVQSAKLSHQPGDLLGVEAGRGFVQTQQPGLATRRASQLNEPLLTGGKSPRELIANGIETEFRAG